MVLLAPTVTALQTVLEVCHAYAGPHDIVYNTTITVYMLVRPQQSPGRYSTRVRLGNEELRFFEEFRYLGLAWLQTVEMIRILKNSSGGKMLLAIYWSKSSHSHLLRQKSNCSSHIVTPFVDVLFGIIHTRTLLENLLSVLVTHSSLIIIPSYTSSILAFSMNATDNINVVFRKFAYRFLRRVRASSNSIVTAIVNSNAYHQSPLLDKWESMLYV